MKLRQCKKCTSVWYCSTECQRAHWTLHKVRCREMVAEQEKLQHMSLTDPNGTERERYWSQWCDLSHRVNELGLVHALGLHRDPPNGGEHTLLSRQSSMCQPQQKLSTSSMCSIVEFS
ncbi:hypothetical protein K438DRAFT_1795163 [Mycena galopus ATCC 62051]|nr:hypothetical protein K438DRAFT_1795163 [Mycena galopus ATCC 62051]